MIDALTLSAVPESAEAIRPAVSVMAEQAFAARMAAQIGCASDGFAPHPLRAAVAKARGSEAAEKVVAIAHAVHGAIGVTELAPLQPLESGRS
jgi:alkylation response protein AidB-like acyl-CoA dehydrogenase